ncbi:YbgA family protein [Bacillus sp. NTK071]|uniref:YbgA family protein n=1 Tax=Bacillus sp. NTK071 TaxID=2802175 RepID=UPI001A8C9EC8|nr:YbgA family protein [Bacillus sp. NTK071]MBN8210953.1 YbgA family protein [Bacillus sp. NTK071]
MADKRIRTLTEKLWARNKYTVMAKGYEHYKNVSTALKNAQSNEQLLDVYALLKDTLKLPYTRKGMRTTLEHMWGYFKKQATTDEKDLFVMKRNELGNTEILSEKDIQSIRTYLLELLANYPSDYLEQSSILNPNEKWNEVYENK